MRTTVIALALASAALSASAQTREQNWAQCSGSGAPDAEIVACTAIIQSGLETPRNLAAAYSNRAHAYEAKSLRDQAIADYTKDIELTHGDDVWGLDNRARLYDRKHLYDDAISDYSEIIANVEGSRMEPAMYKARGADYALKGRYDKAIDDFSKAIALKPDGKDAYVFEMRAEAYEKLGRREQAMSDYREALKIFPGLTSAQAGLQRISGGAPP